MSDSLSEEVIARNLGTRFIGQRVLYYPVLTSTMDVARQEARRGAAEGTVIIADEQTAGRGRLERLWLAPGGNLALSVILKPALSSLPALIMLASLAVVHSIEAVTGLKSQIKWPNDVLIGERKVCGILIENDLRASTVNYSVIGMGINVDLKPADFPVIQATATSLSAELGRQVSRLEVLRRLLVEMERLYLTVSGGGSIYEPWRDNLVTLGRRVRATSGETTCEGVAASVDRDGSLWLRAADGRLTRIVAGDVTLRE